MSPRRKHSPFYSMPPFDTKRQKSVALQRLKGQLITQITGTAHITRFYHHNITQINQLQIKDFWTYGQALLVFAPVKDGPVDLSRVPFDLLATPAQWKCAPDREWETGRWFTEAPSEEYGSITGQFFLDCKDWDLESMCKPFMTDLWSVLGFSDPILWITSFSRM